MAKKYEVTVNDETRQLVITSAGRHWFKRQAKIVHEDDPALAELQANLYLDVVEVKPPTRRRKPKAEAVRDETS